MKRSKLSIPALLGLLILAVSFNGCKETFEFQDVIIFTGTEIDPMIKFPVQEAPETMSFSVSATGPVSEDTRISLSVDASKLDEYNRTYGTNYYLAPASFYSIDKLQVTIPEGKTSSDAITVTVTNVEDLDEEISYVIPLAISNVTGDFPVLEASRTVFIRLSQVIDFMSVDVTPRGRGNANHGYNTFYFDRPTDLDQFTFEMKFLIYEWHEGSNSTQITRLMNWGPGDDNPFNRTNTMNLMRIGEGGYAVDQLQWLHSQGSMGSNTRFELNQWYLMTCTYDGFTYRLYFDGKLDNSQDGVGKTYYFDSFEIGMSWDEGTSYHPWQQRVPGRMSEIRVWNRALGSREIAAGLCGVPSDSEGLIAYWKMNEGEGTIYHDSSGNGRDLDNSDAGYPFQWIEDELNKCAQ